MKMNKLSFLGVAFVALTLSSCGTIYKIYEKSEKKEEDPAALTSLVKDNQFVRGVGCIKNETVADTPYDIEYLNSGGIVGANYDWLLSQWYRAEQYELSKAEPANRDGYYTYDTGARSFGFNRDNHSIRMKLDSGLEYLAKYNHAKNDEYTNKWSHFLLENYFNHGDEDTSIIMRNKTTIPVSFDITINDATFNGDPLTEEEKQTGLNAAQLLLYFRICYDEDGDLGEDTSSKKMWIGMPIYDSRYNVIKKNAFVDEGHEHASNMLVYSASNSDFLPVSSSQGLVLKKTYHVQYDLLPLIREAYNYAINLDESLYPLSSFKGLDFSLLQLYYCNFGFECPGAYNMDITLANFSLGYN